MRGGQNRLSSSVFIVHDEGGKVNTKRLFFAANVLFQRIELTNIKKLPIVPAEFQNIL
jgi:hypothetical protein